MNSMMKKINAFRKDEKGVTMIEYGLMAVLIALACITAVTLVGTNLNNVFNGIASHLHS